MAAIVGAVRSGYGGLTTGFQRLMRRGVGNHLSMEPEVVPMLASVFSRGISVGWQALAAAGINCTESHDVRIDLAAGQVIYDSRRMRMHRDIHHITGPEEVVRAHIVSRLTRALGYRAERIEIERGYEAGRPSRITPRIDIIVNHADGSPFFFIEVKAPNAFEQDKHLIEGQLFKLAALHEGSTGKKPSYLVYYTVEEADGDLIDKAIIIDRSKYATYQAWLDSGEPSIGDTIPGHYDRPRKTPLIKGGERDLAQTFTIDEIRALATNLHNVLWSGGSTGDTDVFTSLINIILAKIQDEFATSEGEEYRFQVEQHGDELERPEDLLDRINVLYREALRDQLGKTGDLADQFVVNREKFSPAKVLYTVGALERYSFVDGKNSLDGKDILGDFFERIQRDGFKQTKGQFFTPTEVVQFMLYGMEADLLSIDLMNAERRLPYIIDPSCGSATFLIEAMRMITSELKRRSRARLSANRAVALRFDELFMPDNHEHKWAREYLYGIEHNFDLATASKVNMILHGDGSSNIFHQDGLKPFRFYEKSGGTNQLRSTREISVYPGHEVNEQFDLIVSNPPFSVELDGDTKRHLVSEFVFGKKKNSENLFIERYYQLLRPGGRLSVVLPESIFDTTENKYIRLFLFMYFDIVAVVSLPRVSFEPYTQTKTSVLFARKKMLEDVQAWQHLWREKAVLYSRLRTRALNYIKVYADGENIGRFPSIRDDDKTASLSTLSDFLQLEFGPEEAGQELGALIEKYRTLIEEVAKTDTDADGPFGVVNSRWTLLEVTKTLDRTIYAAEALNVGYKRTKRGVRPQPNDLFDREIAPACIDRGAVNDAFTGEIERLVALEASLLARQAEVTAARASAVRTRELAKIAAQIGQLTSEQQALEARQARIGEILDRCYQDGVLRAEHLDRLDQDLLQAFDHPLMLRWRSDLIITTRTSPRTIVEEMRSKGLWG